MKSKVYNIIALLMLVASFSLAQHKLNGKIVDTNNSPIAFAEVYNETTDQVVTTDEFGRFEIDNLQAGVYKLVAFSYQYETIKQDVSVREDTLVVLKMNELSRQLEEVTVSEQEEAVFGLNRLNAVEGTAIYAGKKTEVVKLNNMVGNMASNNARQIYAQVVGLNIYENSDAGLQLNIGGRGLDPNRTSNFNTRQNGYDISADVLGYPESYYTPPAEGLEEIQVIRGAASLQYGTQFGGLINFKMKKPTKRKLEWVSRQSVGSYGLLTSFNSFGGTIGKFSYYGYYNYKQGNGFRPNSSFDSHNVYGQLNYKLTSKTNLSFETTYLNYLAQQPGGLTDTQFKEDPSQSTRSRNWFKVDWRLYAFKLQHKFSSKSDLTLNVFGLDASRSAIGFRGDPYDPNTNPLNDEQHDTNGSYDKPRDVQIGEFKNWGMEGRFLKRYKLGGRDAVFLIGSKYYKARNTSIQGAGSYGIGSNFEILNSGELADYPNQSNFVFPNQNISLFGEHVFYLTEKLSITPGVRFENIKTESKGTYLETRYDLAGNVIYMQEHEDNRVLDRSFVLLGLGVSQQQSDNLEVYGNISQNYRSVTFSDIRVASPTFSIDPNITDERGYTADMGVRGKWKHYVSYDLGLFGVAYNDRIGVIFDGDREAERVRKNIGDAVIYGAELFADWNVLSVRAVASNYSINFFSNIAITNSKYIRSVDNGVVGKKVEFIPLINAKAGLKFGYKGFYGSLQYTYLSEQFTDAENSGIDAPGGSREGVIGEIPAYDIVDLSLSYNYKNWKLETGVNNVLDNSYFTRRATGYPGPGIIPSDPRTFYLAIELKLSTRH